MEFNYLMLMKVALFCSGDQDAVVSVTGTIYALDSLNLPVTVPWYAWYQKSQVPSYSHQFL